MIIIDISYKTSIFPHSPQSWSSSGCTDNTHLNQFWSHFHKENLNFMMQYLKNPCGARIRVGQAGISRFSDLSDILKFLTLMIIIDILHLLFLHTMIIIDQPKNYYFAGIQEARR